MTRILVAAAALTAAMTSGALADIVDQRQARQADRIESARRSGELTRQEYSSLKAEQARIAELERRAKADGRIDRREAEALRRAQDEASRHIRQEANDNESRGSRRWWSWNR